MKYKQLSEQELVTIVKQRNNTDKLFAQAGAEALDLSVVSFRYMADAISFCKMFEGATLSGSRLYKYRDEYYLIVALDGMPRAYVRQFCMLTNEFATGYAYGDMRASMIIEHGRLICDDVCYIIKKGYNSIERIDDN